LSERAVSFGVKQESGLIDERLELWLNGCPENALVQVVATMEDPLGREWRSQATWRADEHGRVDLSVQAPVTGDFLTADGMGLFWSMALISPEIKYRWPLGTPFTTRLEALVTGETVASVEIVRRNMGPLTRSVEVREAGVVGTLCYPDDGRVHPGLVVLGGSEGGMPAERAALLASQGFAALALAYFKMENLPEHLLEIPVETVERGIQWLLAQSCVRPGKVGVMGSSKGAELALLTTSGCQQIGAVVAVAPSGIVFQGLGTDEHGDIGSSWTRGGKPVPFASVDMPDEVMTEIARAMEAGKPVSFLEWYLAQFADDRKAQAAEIPVERINGAILMVSGDDDRLWPSSLFARKVMERLERHGHPYERCTSSMEMLATTSIILTTRRLGDFPLMLWVEHRKLMRERKLTHGPGSSRFCVNI